MNMGICLYNMQAQARNGGGPGWLMMMTTPTQAQSLYRMKLHSCFLATEKREVEFEPECNVALKSGLSTVCIMY